MDRRTLLALVLSALVIIAWSSFFPTKGPRNDAPAPSTPAPTTESSEAVSTGYVAAPAVRATEATGSGAVGGQQLGGSERFATAWEAAPEEHLEINTDLMTMELTTLGGGVVAGRLLGFPDGLDRTRPVNLVREGHQVLDVSLQWSDPSGGTIVEAIPLSRVPFSVVEDRQLSAGREGGGTGGHRVVLRARRSDGLEVTREYLFLHGTYQFNHTVQVTTPAAAGTAPDQLALGWRAGMPETEIKKKGAGFAQRATMNGLALIGEEVEEWNPGSFKKNGQQDVRGNVRWAAVRNKYFLAAMIPAEGTATAVHANGDESSARNEVWVDVPLTSATGWKASFEVYLGPSDYDGLTDLGSGLERAVRLGPKLIRPLGRFMLSIINFAHSHIPNYGLVIVLVSVLIRVVLHPLNRISMKSMKAMQVVQPEMQAIRKKYADNPQEMNKRVMELYKQHGVNPLGGCLPVLVQMPFLFALYYVLMFSVDLRMAPFVGWIDDLSAPDTIGRIMGFEIHILPLVMTGVSVLQARSTPKDPRQAMMTQLMPMLFLFLFYNMPSGLVLYWTIMNGMAWAQQAMMNRDDGGAKVAAVAVGGDGLTTDATMDEPDDTGGAGNQLAVDSSAAEPGDGTGEEPEAVLTRAGRGSNGHQRKQQKRRKRR